MNWNSHRFSDAPFIPHLFGVVQSPKMQLDFIAFLQFHRVSQRKENWKPAEHSCNKSMKNDFVEKMLKKFTWRMSLRIDTDHDIFVQSAFKVAAKSVKFTVHIHSKISDFIPKI